MTPDSTQPAASPSDEAGKSAKTRPLIEREKLGVLTKIGQGGQGVVYRAPNVKTKFAASMVFKEYKAQTRGDIDFTALAAMPALVEDSLSYAQAERLISIAAWPCALVDDGGASAGFVMPAIPAEFFIPLKTVKGVSSAAAEFQHLMNHPSVLAARGLDVDDVQRYTLLREVASGLAFLHKQGVCVGDISPKNLLFSLSPREAIYFIDCDAMRINGVSALPQMETPGWEVPAGEELATVYSDAYKLGLLALRLVAGHHDTMNLQHIPSSTPALLRQVITDTISRAPQQRPLPEAWSYVLGNAIEQAQHQMKTAPSSTQVSVPPPPPPTPVVHSRPSTRPSAPPPPPPSALPPPPAWPRVDASAPPRQSQSNSSTMIWAGVTLAAVVIVAVVVVVVALSLHSNPTLSSTPGSSVAAEQPTAAPAPATTEAPPPDPEAAAVQQLQQLAAGDRDFVNAQLADHYIPQLSSKHSQPTWTFDDGIEYHNEQILREHQQLRQQYNAKLLWSGDWPAAHFADGLYWVTVAPVYANNSGDVLAWCTNHGRDSDHCYAQDLDSGTTAHN
jgi:serine/threonine protein kinase